MAIVNTKVYESIPERDGRKYVTFILTTEYGDSRTVGPMLVEEFVNPADMVDQLETSVLKDLAVRERHEAYRLALEEGENPSNLVYKYNDKGSVINDIYSNKAIGEEAEVKNRLSKIQNTINHIKLFLGLV